MRNASIVCTIGPASGDRRTLRAMADAGMAVARINASHGSPDEHAEYYERVRQIDAARPDPVATMLDLGGPEIRTAATETSIELTAGDVVALEPGDEMDADRIGLSGPLPGIETGDRVLFDDGRIETVVTSVAGDRIRVEVESGGPLGGRKSVIVPGVDLDLDVVTDADRTAIERAVEADVDFVAASFVRDAEDVYAVGEAIEAHGDPIPVIAKIERAAAVSALSAIVDASYGVMVARGDLGVECPMEDVPIFQKRIIKTCRRAGVPVITATEMLDSMVHATRPTRAEASDVANAVLDGTDAVMLSAETAVGDHPVRVVETMARIVREIERSDEYREVMDRRVPSAKQTPTRTGALARSASYLAGDVGASCIVVVTESGYTALRAAKYRPTVPILAATPSDRVRRKLALSWGVYPLYVEFAERRVDAIIEDAVGAAIEAGPVESGDTVVVLSGIMTGLERASTTNMLKVHVAAETLATGTGVVAGRAIGPVAYPEGDAIPAGAIVAIPRSFDGELSGLVEDAAAIVAERPGLTGYAAMVARELGIPMVSGAPIDHLEGGVTVTVDAERGVIYEGAITETSEAT